MCGSDACFLRCDSDGLFHGTAVWSSHHQPAELQRNFQGYWKQDICDPSQFNKHILVPRWFWVAFWLATVLGHPTCMFWWFSSSRDWRRLSQLHREPLKLWDSCTRHPVHWGWQVPHTHEHRQLWPGGYLQENEIQIEWDHLSIWSNSGLGGKRP